MRLVVAVLLISCTQMQVEVLGDDEYAYHDDAEYYDEEVPFSTEDDYDEVVVHFTNISQHGVTIDYNECDGYFYTDEETDENCRQSVLPNSIHEVFGASVNDCCGFHGFFVWSDCHGEDKDGNPVRVEAVPVCKEAGQDDMEEDIKYFPKTFQCPEECTSQTMESFSTGDPKITNKEGGNPILTDFGKSYKHFCLAYACADYAGVGWKASADVCHCPEDSDPMLASPPASKQDNNQNIEPEVTMNTNRPVEDEPAPPVIKESKQEKSQTENDIKSVDTVKTKRPVAETRNAPEAKSQNTQGNNGPNGVSPVSLSAVLASAVAIRHLLLMRCPV